MGAGPGALLLLFAKGERPDAATLRVSAAGSDRLAVTSSLGDERAGLCGIELLRDGMTYDLVGAQPGVGVAAPALPQRLGVSAGVAEGDLEALALRPGPHLAQGGSTLPVVRTMMGVAILIAPHLPRLQALGWAESGALIGCDFFVSVMSAWVSGGPFPGLGLTTFVAADDGSLRSEGLAFFTGQELRLVPALAEDRAAGTRLGVRLINQLIGRRRLNGSEAVVSPDGRRLILEPSADRRVITVRPG